jgi:hypothetical protein
MHGLGELEAAVMNVFWCAGQPVKVRDGLTASPPSWPTPPVMTVLDNRRRKSIRRTRTAAGTAIMGT